MTSYIQHLHAFRGFAILNIVGAHAWSFMIFWTGNLDSNGLKWMYYLTETLFHGGTLYFAVISGLLFNKVLQAKGWQAFYRNKLFNVIFPYVVMTFVMTLAYWKYYLITAAQNGTEASFFSSILTNLYAGTASIHFWYIPVLMVLFLITPLLALIQSRVKWLMYVLILMPLVISRSPFPDFLKWQSFCYFIGAYAAGMFLGANYTHIHQFVTKYAKLLVFVLVGVSITITLQYVWGYKAESFFSSRQSLIYIQKVIVCLLVLHWFLAKEGHLPRWICNIGSYAFAIYFLHVVFIGFVISGVQPWLAEGRPAGLIFAFGGLNFIAAISGSIILAMLIKRVFGRHSRKLIGA